MDAPIPDGVTRLLHEWRAGDDSALQRLIPLVYRELRQVARRCLYGKRNGQTLQTTGLVNEAYLRLARSNRVQWQDRGHFFAVAAQLMRRVLVDEARKRGFQKRGGGAPHVAFSESDLAAAEPHVDLLAIDDALERLATFSSRKCRVVEMRFFGGLTIEETALALGVSNDIVKREWRTARLWLLRALGEACPEGSRTDGDGTGALESD